MGISIRTKVKLLENIPKKKCKYCKSKENLTYDHKLPLIRGGTSDIKNIQILCRECNQMKSNFADYEIKRVMKWAYKLVSQKICKTSHSPIETRTDEKKE